MVGRSTSKKSERCELEHGMIITISMEAIRRYVS
jgi:hypothetical protein